MQPEDFEADVAAKPLSKENGRRGGSPPNLRPPLRTHTSTLRSGSWENSVGLQPLWVDRDRGRMAAADKNRPDDMRLKTPHSVVVVTAGDHHA